MILQIKKQTLINEYKRLQTRYKYDLYTESKNNLKSLRLRLNVLRKRINNINVAIKNKDSILTAKNI